MERHFMKSLKALCTGVMTLCVASLSLTSCYDDSALNAKMDELGKEVSELDARLQAVEALTAKLEALTARVDALYTLKFQVTTTNELQYSFDGGTTWVSTGIVLAKELECTCEVPEACKCVEVSLTDNGDSVTITVGDKKFTIEKPEEIVFEIKAGKLYFESEGTQTVAMKSSGIEDISVLSAPKGWWAEINSDGLLEITAPNYEETQTVMDWETWTEIPAKYAASGYVKVHACGTEGKCMVGKLPVEVAENPVVVKAYDGNAYFTVVGQYGTFYYGVSTKDSFESDVQPLLAKMNESGWSDYTNNEGELSVTATIESLLGTAPVAGQEYVVWALVEDSMKSIYTTEDFIKSYYSLVEVSALEDKSKNNAYNIDITIDVTGADSYIAMANPFSEYAEPEYYKEQMVMAYAEGTVYGKKYNESYSGSLLDVAYGTTFSMSGNYQPNWKFYLYVLPLDGRPADEYTPENVYMFEYTTASLAAGGSINATAKQVTKYIGEVYDYDLWEYVEKEIVLDPQTQLGVELAPSASGWKAQYYEWMTPEQWAEYGVSDEKIVEYLLLGYGETPVDVKKMPCYAVAEALPGQTLHFVALYVDSNGKYGQIAKLELTTEDIDSSNIEAELNDNTVEGNLKNTNTLEVTITTNVPASQYKYVWFNTDYMDQEWKSLDRTSLAKKIYVETEDAVVVKAEELVDGKLLVENHEYGRNYFFAVLPYDAEGVPGAVASTLEYTNIFLLDNVITENLVGEPTVEYSLPEMMDGSYGQSYCWYDDGYQYSFGFKVTPAAETEVVALLLEPTVDGEYGYKSSMTVAEKASAMWADVFPSNGSIGTFTQAGNYDPRFFNSAVNEPLILLSWKDADDNYYYKEISLADEFAMMKATLDFNKVGVQYTFDWTALAQQFGAENLPSVMDFGCTTPSYFMIGLHYYAVDQSAPEDLWMAYVEGGYVVTPTSPTEGEVALISYDYATGEQVKSVQMTYSNLTETTCTFNAEQFMIENVTATLSSTHVKVTSQAIGM